MKTLFSFAIMFLLSATMTFAQSEKTLIRTLAVDGAVAVVELPGEITVKNWDSDNIKITTKISTLNFSEAVLKSLIAAGRYNIESATENGQMVISMPKSSKKVTISNVAIIENLKFEILVPFGIEIKTTNTSSAM